MGRGTRETEDEDEGRLTAAAAAEAMVGIGFDVVAVDLRARDLQDWLVQVAHFVLSSDVVGVELVLDDETLIEQMIVRMMKMVLNEWKYVNNTTTVDIYLTYEGSEQTHGPWLVYRHRLPPFRAP